MRVPRPLTNARSESFRGGVRGGEPCRWDRGYSCTTLFARASVSRLRHGELRRPVLMPLRAVRAVPADEAVGDAARG